VRNLISPQAGEASLEVSVLSRTRLRAQLVFFEQMSLIFSFSARFHRIGVRIVVPESDQGLDPSTFSRKVESIARECQVGLDTQLCAEGCLGSVGAGGRISRASRLCIAP